jgi:hypothetical protein
MFPRNKKAPSIAEINPGLASQLKLDAVRLVRQRRGHEASLKQIIEKISEIESAFGDRIDVLLDSWGFQV